ncbi:MAG: cytochrome c oxidase subunit I [Bdellovibrionales bacterium RBG_16_40_8]|nr:MAG: cytochrome c oxidase subunit I [Bdellovibrionales bacterium RBG_16_40_8]
MTSTSTQADEINYLNHQKGIWSWLTTLDHKRIGILYMITVLTFFLIGGIFAMLLRVELFATGKNIMSAAQYNQVMTFHGAIMVFMVIIPGIPAFLGNFILPLHIGAKDVAFPKLNLLSWYCLVVGAVIAVSSLLYGGVDTGWTFYTPYSIHTNNGTTFVVIGAFVMGFSSILTGLNFIVTVHKLRAPGMTFWRMPLFVWALYSTAVIQILATPILAITLLLIAAERILGVGIFDPALGGDPILFQHFFWFYSHPAVYIMILPAMGIVTELITTFSRKVIFGYKAIALSSVGIAAVSFFVWGHHLFVSGQSELAGIIFSFITMLVGVPTAIKVFNWTATMYKGSIQFSSPMLFALGFLFLFTIGGVTGIILATIAVDVRFHDTYFVVAHFHYVMVGGTLMAIMGGIYYWLPKIFGRMYSEFWARITWVLIFIGFNVAFFPQFVLGAMGMPRRYYDYLPQYASLNRISSVGSWTIGLGFFIALGVIIYAITKGKKAPANPWGGKTLEWTIASPPPHENFLIEPIITAGPYEYR